MHILDFFLLLIASSGFDYSNLYFSMGYFTAGNEPSFQMPWMYHYANRPDVNALRVRQVVYTFFSTGIGG